MKLSLTTVVFVTTVVTTVVACQPEPEQQSAGHQGDCSVAVVHSDYVSTAVSLLNADGTLCLDSIVTSGSAAVDIVAALSGDVVLPSTRDPAGRVVLVDRYPHAVVSLVDAENPADVSQLSVAMGFTANPYDVAFLGDGRAYVARHETNPTPEVDAAGLDAGGDLLVVNTAELEVTGRIPLDADDGFDPMPARVVPLGDRVWVVLSHLSRDFSAAGPGRVLGVDPALDAVVSSVTLDGLKNCSAAVPDLTGEGLWVGCSGLLGQVDALAASGLVSLSLEGGELEEQWRVSAQEALGSPVAYSIASVAPNVAVFSVFGSHKDGTPDRLLWADSHHGVVEELNIHGSAYELGDLLWSPDEERLLLADAAPQSPTIRRFVVGDAVLTELEPVEGSPATGLPPRHLAFYR